MQSYQYQNLKDRRHARTQDYYMREVLVWLVVVGVLGFAACVYFNVPLQG